MRNETSDTLHRKICCTCEGLSVISTLAATIMTSPSINSECDVEMNSLSAFAPEDRPPIMVIHFPLNLKPLASMDLSVSKHLESNTVIVKK